MCRPIRLQSSGVPRFAIILLALILSAAPTAAIGQGRRAELAKWFQQLADREPSVRAEAKRQLMGLETSELDLLRDVAAAAMPLKPAQIDPLQDVVVYRRTREAILKMPRLETGFLGVSLPSLAMEDDESTPTGVPVLGRLRGFIAYRLLENGDIILAIGPGDELRNTFTPTQLRTIVSSMKAGDVVSVQVLRGTQTVTVKFPLDAPPQVDDSDRGVQGVVNDAEHDADAYWEKNFLPLIGKNEI